MVTNSMPAIEFLMTCNTECKILALMFINPFLYHVLLCHTILSLQFVNQILTKWFCVWRVFCATCIKRSTSIKRSLGHSQGWPLNTGSTVVPGLQISLNVLYRDAKVKVVSHIGLILTFHWTKTRSYKHTFFIVFLCKKSFLTYRARVFHLSDLHNQFFI